MFYYNNQTEIYFLPTTELPKPVPEIIDPVFAKTSPERSLCMNENERFGLVFAKTGSINSGTGTGTSFLYYINAYGPLSSALSSCGQFFFIKIKIKEKLCWASSFFIPERMSL
jgi:hypothetical protein